MESPPPPCESDFFHYFLFDFSLLYSPSYQPILIRNFIIVVLQVIAWGVGVDKSVTALYQIHKLELMCERGWKLTHEVLWWSMVYNLNSSLFSLLFLAIVLFRLSLTLFITTYLPLSGPLLFFVFFSSFLSCF